jgi:hypothetical protein
VKKNQSDCPAANYSAKLHTNTSTSPTKDFGCSSIMAIESENVLNCVKSKGRDVYKKEYGCIATIHKTMTRHSHQCRTQ